MWEWMESQYSLQALSAAWGAVLIGYALFLLGEQIIPAGRNPGYSEIAADLRANIAFFILNPLALLLGAILSRPIASFLGGPLIRVDLASAGSNAIAGFAVAFIPFLIFDFFYYWFHRCQHASPWLWELHRLHHSEAALNVTTNYRHHWLEEFFRAFFIFLPMNWIISIGVAESFMAALLIRQWSNFFHANIKVSLGPATPIITGPQYHRIHHSVLSEHVGRNYAAFFPFWDWVFGTYWRPAPAEWPDTGLPETNGVWPLREIVFSPFVAWYRRARAMFK